MVVGSSPLSPVVPLPTHHQLFQLNGSLHEWDFRSRLDRFAAPCGMLLAFVWIRFTERRAAPSVRAKPAQTEPKPKPKTSTSAEDNEDEDSDSKTLPSTTVAPSVAVSLWEALSTQTRQRVLHAVTAASIAVVLAYVWFSRTCASKVKQRVNVQRTCSARITEVVACQATQTLTFSAVFRFFFPVTFRSFSESLPPSLSFSLSLLLASLVDFLALVVALLSHSLSRKHTLSSLTLAHSLSSHSLLTHSLLTHSLIHYSLTSPFLCLPLLVSCDLYIICAPDSASATAATPQHRLC